MRGRSGHLMRRAAYWAPAVVVAALLVGGIGALWTHGLPAHAGVRSRQTATAPGRWAALAQTPEVEEPVLALSGDKVIIPHTVTPSAGAYLYNAASDTWTTTASLHEEIAQAAASVLADGRLLLTGGYRVDCTVNCTDPGSEIYDPVRDSWSITASMPTGRDYAGAVTLSDGRVLVVGGIAPTSPADYLATAQIYDPRSQVWTTVASMNFAREGPTLLLLHDGRVLVSGGIGPTAGSNPRGAPGGPNCGIVCPTQVNALEIYDPVSNTWTNIGDLPTPCYGYALTVLPSGMVLLTGGSTDTGTGPIYGNYLLDPTTLKWTPVAPMNDPRFYHTATLMATGDVLVAGGYDSSGAGPTSAEIYDPASNTWTPTASGMTWHVGASAALLTDGRVLVHGFATGCCADPAITARHKDSGGQSTGVDAFSTVPGLPGNVKATAGSGAASVTWSAAIPDGSPISGYTVTASPGGKSATVSGTATSAAVSGLSAGTSYTFTIAATNGFGSGPASAPSNAVTPSSPPPGPTPTPTTPPAPSGPAATATLPPVTPTAAPTATATPGSGQTVQTSTSTPPGPSTSVNRSTGGSPPIPLLLGLLVLLILLLGGGALLLARRGSHT